MVEETTEDIQDTQPQAESTEEVSGEDQTIETEESSNKGAQNRIRELNAAKKLAEAKASSLEARIAQLTGSSPSTDIEVPEVQDEPLLQPGEEIDAVELDRRLRAREQNVLRRTDALINLRTKQNEAITRINNETAEVIRQYPQLDPNSDLFNQELSDAISEATEAYTMRNPYSASVKTFVSKLMKPYQGAVSKEVGKVTETIARQVSQSALKPNSIKQPEKTAEEKTLSELEEELGIVRG